MPSTDSFPLRCCIPHISVVLCVTLLLVLSYSRSFLSNSRADASDSCASQYPVRPAVGGALAYRFLDQDEPKGKIYLQYTANTTATHPKMDDRAPKADLTSATFAVEGTRTRDQQNSGSLFLKTMEHAGTTRGYYVSWTPTASQRVSRKEGKTEDDRPAAQSSRKTRVRKDKQDWQAQPRVSGSFMGAADYERANAITQGADRTATMSPGTSQALLEGPRREPAARYGSSVLLAPENTYTFVDTAAVGAQVPAKYAKNEALLAALSSLQAILTDKTPLPAPTSASAHVTSQESVGGSGRSEKTDFAGHTGGLSEFLLHDPYVNGDGSLRSVSDPTSDTPVRLQPRSPSLECQGAPPTPLPGFFPDSWLARKGLQSGTHMQVEKPLVRFVPKDNLHFMATVRHQYEEPRWRGAPLTKTEPSVEGSVFPVSHASGDLTGNTSVAFPISGVNVPAAREGPQSKPQQAPNERSHFHWSQLGEGYRGTRSAKIRPRSYDDINAAKTMIAGLGLALSGWVPPPVAAAVLGLGAYRLARSAKSRDEPKKTAALDFLNEVS